MSVIIFHQPYPIAYRRVCVCAVMQPPPPRGRRPQSSSRSSCFYHYRHCQLQGTLVQSSLLPLTPWPESQNGSFPVRFSLFSSQVGDREEKMSSRILRAHAHHEHTLGPIKPNTYCSSPQPPPLGHVSLITMNDDDWPPPGICENIEKSKRYPRLG